MEVVFNYIWYLMTETAGKTPPLPVLARAGLTEGRFASLKRYMQSIGGSANPDSCARNKQ